MHHCRQSILPRIYTNMATRDGSPCQSSCRRRPTRSKKKKRSGAGRSTGCNSATCAAPANERQHGPSALEQYEFDRLGYTVLPRCLSTTELAQINAELDQMQPFGPLGTWYGNVEVHSYYGAGRGVGSPDDGVNLQHIYEAGAPFERLLDHGPWYDRVCHYFGRATPYVNEFFANVRGQGGFIGLHSGGWYAKQHPGVALQHGIGRVAGHIIPQPGEIGLPQFEAGDECVLMEGRPEREWAAQLITVIVALTDIGEGDGATVCVPMSHKSLFSHPQPAARTGMWMNGALVEGGKEIHLRAGDALLFSDSLLHGAAARRNPGERRVSAAHASYQFELGPDR